MNGWFSPPYAADSHCSSTAAAPAMPRAWCGSVRCGVGVAVPNSRYLPVRKHGTQKPGSLMFMRSIIKNGFFWLIMLDKKPVTPQVVEVCVRQYMEKSSSSHQLPLLLADLSMFCGEAETTTPVVIVCCWAKIMKKKTLWLHPKAAPKKFTRWSWEISQAPGASSKCPSTALIVRWPAEAPQLPFQWGQMITLCFLLIVDSIETYWNIYCIHILKITTRNSNIISPELKAEFAGTR